MPQETKLTPETAEKVYSIIRAGNCREVACSAVGITSATLRNWMTWGNPAHPKYRGEPYEAFVTELDRVEAESQATLVGNIAAAGGGRRGDWKALAWIAEKRWPKKFGQRFVVELEQEVHGLLEVAESVLPPEWFAALLAGLAAREAAVGGDGAADDGRGAAGAMDE